MNFNIGDQVEWTSTRHYGDVMSGVVVEFNRNKKRPRFTVETTDGRQWHVPGPMLRPAKKKIAAAKAAALLKQGREQAALIRIQRMRRSGRSALLVAKVVATRRGANR